MSWSPWWLGFIRLNTQSQTDGQHFVSSQAYCCGQIKADSILCSEFKQGHFCLTVKGIVVTSSVCFEKQASRTTVADKLKQNVCFLCFRERLFLWHLKLIFPQSSTEFNQRRYVTHQYSVSWIVYSWNFLLKVLSEIKWSILVQYSKGVLVAVGTQSATWQEWPSRSVCVCSGL